MFNYRTTLHNCVLYLYVIIWYVWFRIPRTTESHYIKLIESPYINLIESFFTIHTHKTIHRMSQVNLIVETQFPIFVCVKISKADSYSTCLKTTRNACHHNFMFLALFYVSRVIGLASCRTIIKLIQIYLIIVSKY